MGRWFTWHFAVAKILLLCQLVIASTPVLAEEAKAKDKDADQKVRIVSEDPVVDGFFRKRWEAFTKEEQEIEDIAFLFFAVVGGGSGLAAFKSIFSSAPGKALAERRQFKDELIEKMDQKRIWEKHEHDVVKNYIESRKQVEALRRKIEQTQGDVRPLQKQLREKEIQLAKAAGNLEQSPNECVKLLSYIAKLDDADEKIAASLQKMLAAAEINNKPHSRELRKAIDEWADGKGLYAVEDWLRHSLSQPALKTEKMKSAMADYETAQTLASELVKVAVPFYNDVAQKRNLRIRQTQSKFRQLPFLKKTPVLSRWHQVKQDELPLYNYRRSETGHDTKNFDETDSHHQPNGNTISRARLAEAAKDQCGLGYEQLTNEVKSLERKSGLVYTFRNQETLLGVTGLGALGMWASNEVSKWNTGKSITQNRTEGISMGKRVDAVSNDLSAQMTADDAPDGPRLLAPLYDGTTDALLKQMPHIAAQVEKNIKSLGGQEAAGKQEALNNLKPLLTKKATIRNSVSLSTFQVVSEQRIGDIQRFAEIIRAKEEGTLVTATSEQVNLVVDATLRKFFSTVSSDVLQLLDNDGTIDQIRTEVLEHLRKTNRGNEATPDTSLPIKSLPGVKVENTNPKSSVKAEPIHVPTSTPTGAPNPDAKHGQASSGPPTPAPAALAIQTSLTMGEPPLAAAGMGPMLLPPSINP